MVDLISGESRDKHLLWWTWVLLCHFLFCNHLAGEEKDGCFAFIVFLMSCGCYCSSHLCLFLTVPWVGLQCLIVVFPGHAHLLFVI